MACRGSKVYPVGQAEISGTVTSRPGGLNVGGLITEVALNATTWTLLPATALSSRNQLSIQNISGIDIKINYDAFAALPLTYTGTTIASGSERHYLVTDNIKIYAKSASGVPTIQVEELS